jgi:hypothetical protein
MQKTLLLTLEFPPDIGGVGEYYRNLSLGLSKDAFFILAHRKNLLYRWFSPRWIKAIIRAVSMVRGNGILYPLHLLEHHQTV